MTLTAHQVTGSYDASGTAVFRDVTVTVEPGRILGLTGPSGSGKSTLTRILAGLHRPDAGIVTCDGKPAVARRGRMPGTIALLHQSPRAATNPRMRLRDIITEPAGRRTAQSAVDELAHRVGLTGDLLDRTPGQVSDGQLQRACLARALATHPRYLLCDEVTAMLDPATTTSIAAVLADLAVTGVGILAVSHDHPLLDAWADSRVDITDLGAAIPTH